MRRNDQELKGAENHYMYPKGEECPQVLKHGIHICTKDCLFPEKCWWNMTRSEKKQMRSEAVCQK